MECRHSSKMAVEVLPFITRQKKKGKKNALTFFFSLVSILYLPLIHYA